jgi:MraZ protein
MRFIGNIEAKVDSKGRAFLPATFRKVLSASGEEGLILRKDVFQPCLVIYPESVWNEQMDTLRSRLNRWNAEHQRIFRQFVSDAEILNLDSNGRFLISKRQLTQTGINQNLKFIGMGDCIEIWNNDTCTAQMKDPEEFSNILQEMMSPQESTNYNIIQTKNND